MKRYYFILLVFLAACSANDHRSDAYGNFEAVDIIVSAQANGQILDLSIREGQKLDAGQKVGLVDTTNLHLQKKLLRSKQKAIASGTDNIKAQIGVQQQKLKNLMTDQERVEKLFKDGAATQKQLDDINGAVDLVEKQIRASQTQFARIRDEVDALETQVEQVNEGIQRSIITNPVQGTILTKFSETGEITALGKPLYKIAQLDELNLKVYVSGDQLPHIRIGHEVQVLIDNTTTENTELKGVIGWIAEEAEFTPKTIQTKKERVNLVYAVKVRVKNDGALKIGMPGEVNFN